MQGWKHADDFDHLFQEGFLNAALGWCLGTGFHWHPPLFRAMQEKCGFDKGECFVAIFEPNSPIHKISEWKVIDIADAESYMANPLIHGQCRYDELEAFQPSGVTVEFVEKNSLLNM